MSKRTRNAIADIAARIDIMADDINTIQARQRPVAIQDMMIMVSNMHEWIRAIKAHLDTLTQRAENARLWSTGPDTAP